MLLLFAHGWTPNARDPQRPLETAMRWPAPSSPSPVGLGGGLTYAIDGAFCAKVLPRVGDDLWVGAEALSDCAAVHAAVARAFRVWEINHPSIKFVDVSSRACATPTDGSAEPLEAFGAAAATDGCVLPEIVVRAPIGDAGYNESARFALGNYKEPSTLAYAELVPASSVGVRKTDGHFAAAGFQIARVRISINTRMLWRLDGQFCLPFDGAAGRVVGKLVWAMAALGGAVGFGAIVRRAVAPKLPRRARLEQVGRRWQLLWLGILGLLLCFPPTFDTLIISRCARGADFEFVLAHEIGHALGAGHPQDGAALNHNYQLPQAPLRAGAVGCFDDATLIATSEHSADSVLDSFAAHARGYCLSADDVDGLRWLYPPPCGKPLNRATDDEVICPTDRPSRLGLYRVLVTAALAVVASAVFTALATLLLAALARAAERQRLERRELDKAAANATIAAAEEARRASRPATGAAPATEDDVMPDSPEPRRRSILTSLVDFVRRPEPQAPMPTRRLSHALVAAASAAAASAAGTDRPLAPYSMGYSRAPGTKRQADTESLTSYGGTEVSSFKSSQASVKTSRM